jgi:hypothetical protein
LRTVTNWATTIALLEGALLATLVVVLAVSALVHASVLHATTELLGLCVVKVLHEVLLDFLEAALLTLLVQLVGGHPELYGEGAGAEGSGLVEALNGFLGAVDIAVENEVLTVGRVGVKVLALSELD